MGSRIDDAINAALNGKRPADPNAGDSFKGNKNDAGNAGSIFQGLGKKGDGDDNSTPAANASTVEGNRGGAAGTAAAAAAAAKPSPKIPQIDSGKYWDMLKKKTEEDQAETEKALSKVEADAIDQSPAEESDQKNSSDLIPSVTTDEGPAIGSSGSIRRDQYRAKRPDSENPDLTEPEESPEVSAMRQYSKRAVAPKDAKDRPVKSIQSINRTAEELKRAIKEKSGYEDAQMENARKQMLEAQQALGRRDKERIEQAEGLRDKEAAKTSKEDEDADTVENRNKNFFQKLQQRAIARANRQRIEAEMQHPGEELSEEDLQKIAQGVKGSNLLNHDYLREELEQEAGAADKAKIESLEALDALPPEQAAEEVQRLDLPGIAELADFDLDSLKAQAAENVLDEAMKEVKNDTAEASEKPSFDERADALRGYVLESKASDEVKKSLVDQIDAIKVEKESERTDWIAGQLGKKDTKTDRKIETLQANEKLNQRMPLKENKIANDMNRAKEIQTFLRRGFTPDSTEKVKVNADSYKEFMESDEGATGSVKFPTNMTRSDFASVESFEKQKRKESKAKQKEYREQLNKTKSEIQNVKARIKELEEKEKNASANEDIDETDASASLNRSQLYGAKQKLAGLTAEEKKLSRKYDESRGYIFTSKTVRKSYAKPKTDKGKKKVFKKGQKTAKNYKFKNSKKYSGAKSFKAYSFKKTEKVKKAKKLNMKEVSVNSEMFEDSLNTFVDFLGWDPNNMKDRSMAMEMAVIYQGICPDRNGKLWDKKLKDGPVEIKERIFVDAWEQMMTNYQQTGFPFAYTNTSYKIANRYRFNIPMMPPQIAKALTRKGARFANWSVYELTRRGYEEWRNKVVPALAANAKSDQRLVMHDMIKSIAWMYGDISLASGILDDNAFTTKEAFDSLNTYASLYPNQEELIKINEKCRKRVERATERVERKGTRTVKGQDGTYRTFEDASRNSPDVFAQITKLQRAQSLMGDVTLGASAAMEHIKGNFSNSLAAKMMCAAYHVTGPTAATYEMASTDEMQKIVFDAVRLLQIAGNDGLQYAINSGYKLGSGDAIEYARKFLQSRGMKPEEAEEFTHMSPNERANFLKANQGRINTFINRYADFASNFATGEWVCKTGDVKRFFEFLLISAKREGMTGLDANTFERMLLADPAQTITDLMTRPSGVNAAVMMMDSTIGGMNPFTDFYDDLIARNGWGDFMFANFVTMFPKYGFQAIGKVLPLSHSVMYLASKGYYVTKAVFTGNGVNIHAADTHDRLDTLIGGNDGFLAGLAQNMMMDVAQLGTNALFLGTQLAVLLALGFQEPPEDNKKFVYSEWRLFTNVIPGGIQVKANWYLNEIYGVIGGPAVLGAAIALKEDQQARQEGRDADFGTAWGVFRSGAWDILQNTGVAQVTKFGGFISDFADMLVNDQMPDEPTGGNLLFNQILLTGAKGVTKTIEPRFIRTLYSSHAFSSEGNLAHSTKQIYDPTSDNGGTMSTTDIDAMWRRWTYNDPMGGVLMNFLSGITGTNGTGYLREQMPLVTESDPTSMIWAKRFSEVDGRELNWNSSDEDKQIIVDRVLEAYDNYGGIEGMTDNGIVVPYMARYYVKSYLYAQRNANMSSYYERAYSKNGFSSNEEKEAFYQEVQRKNNALYDKIQEFGDNKLPYSPYKLHRYETDYWSYYYEDTEDGGRKAIPTDEYYYRSVIKKDPSVHQQYYASGDHKSGLLPYLTVDTDNVGTFDNQKAAPWYDAEGNLNKDQLLSDIGGETIPSGQYEGQKLSNVIGGQYSSQDGWIPTTGSRASEYENQPWGNDYDWPTGDESDLFTGNLGENGKKTTSSDWKSNNKSGNDSSSAGWGYTSSRRYSSSYRRSSGGGSSRAASIYSRPASSLNADRAATMYSKNRNYTKYDYLRPDFETKGSRDAYKRSDI